MSRSHRRHRLPALVVGLALVGWLTVHLASGGTTSARAQLPVTEPREAAGDTLLVEPGDGMAAVYSLLAAPHHTLDMTMYELADPTVETVLARDAARGVRVRVILDGRLERSHNLSAYEYLHAHGVAVTWASRRYYVTHEKAFVVDRRVAVVMSLNLTSRYYATTRDVAVVDRDPRDVAAIESVFAADFTGAAVGTPVGDDLVWSPRQSGADLRALIGTARHSIDLESEELSDPSVISALVAAARRGVQVTVAMTYQRQWAPAFTRLVDVGARVRVLYGESPLYIHAKILVVDAGSAGGRAFVGSQNISSASLDDDRELGLVIMAPSLVGQLSRVVRADAAVGRAWATGPVRG